MTEGGTADTVAPVRNLCAKSTSLSGSTPLQAENQTTNKKKVHQKNGPRKKLYTANEREKKTVAWSRDHTKANDPTDMLNQTNTSGQLETLLHEQAVDTNQRQMIHLNGSRRPKKAALQGCLLLHEMSREHTVKTESGRSVAFVTRARRSLSVVLETLSIER